MHMNPNNKCEHLRQPRRTETQLRHFYMFLEGLNDSWLHDEQHFTHVPAALLEALKSPSLLLLYKVQCWENVSYSMDQ